MSGPGASLLAWFGAHARELPWRGPFPRDPYRVLVAEVMLQQTQVERVIGAYRRFLARFPTLANLADATENEVLMAFSGLGYYRRARLLHRAAREVKERGDWPQSQADLASLPGFGAYTSAALSAFAFGGHRPPVDGNVARVAARLDALELPLGSARLLAAGHDLAARLFAEADTPEVWEALMELGATVCTPATPSCSTCPISGSCAGFATGNPNRYPLPRRQRKVEDHRWATVWIERSDGRVLLRRVSEGQLLAGLWLPPFGALATGEEALPLAQTLARESGCAGPLVAATPVTHQITYRRILVWPFVGAKSDGRVAEAQDGESWEDRRAPGVPTSSLFEKLAAVCSAEGHKRDAPPAWPAGER